MWYTYPVSRTKSRNLLNLLNAASTWQSSSSSAPVDAESEARRSSDCSRRFARASSRDLSSAATRATLSSAKRRFSEMFSAYENKEINLRATLNNGYSSPRPHSNVQRTQYTETYTNASHYLMSPSQYDEQWKTGYTPYHMSANPFI